MMEMISLGSIEELAGETEHNAVYIIYSKSKTLVKIGYLH
jgi:hypothetical protein